MTFSQLLRNNLRFVIVIPLIIAGLVLGGSLFIEPKYKSSVSLLVVQQQTSTEIDAQAAVKSAEQMADILARVVDSETFRSAVLASGEVKVNLSSQPWKRAKEWHKMVKTKNITDTGILMVDVYQPTSAQATKLATAIEKVLTTQSLDFLGVNAESVSLRQLNPPAPTNNKPATPNLILNTIVGWLFGLIVSLSLLLLFPNIDWNRYSVVPVFRSRRQESPVSRFEPEPEYGSGLIYSEKLSRALADDSEIFSDEPPVDFPIQEKSSQEVNFVSRANDILKRQF